MNPQGRTEHKRRSGFRVHPLLHSSCSCVAIPGHFLHIFIRVMHKCSTFFKKNFHRKIFFFNYKNLIIKVLDILIHDIARPFESMTTKWQTFFSNIRIGIIRIPSVKNDSGFDDMKSSTQFRTCSSFLKH